MNSFPTITHIALTVRGLDVSVPWYTRLFDAEPVLDEETGAFRHVVWSLGDTLLGLHQSPTAITPSRSTSAGPASITLPSPAPTAPPSTPGRPDSTSSASRTATSSTPPTARDCPSRTLSTFPSRSSPQRAERAMTIIKPISIRTLST